MNDELLKNAGKGNYFDELLDLVNNSSFYNYMDKKEHENTYGVELSTSTEGVIYQITLSTENDNLIELKCSYCESYFKKME